jgi:alkanesulfonate monooxygenase SsuD/methylene tetrahydromethanopterin reductase-like flavin-dependent oxidoreductase (luciferase family)
MFTEEEPSFTGKHHSISNVLNNPRPLRGDIPIMVGGSGEKKTLRLVARYADACNVFGDVAHVRHLMGVLDGHCADVGRDPSEITRTRMASVFIDADDAAARAKFDAAGVDPRRATMALVGGPERIAEGVQELRDAGIEGLTISLLDVHDTDLVRLAGETIAPLMPSHD